MCCSSSKKMHGTYKFVDNITKMWNILNIKTPTSGINLNDKNREPFRDPNDMRLKFLENIATSFKKMDNSFVGHRMRGLTVDTSNALHQTLNGIVELEKHCFHVTMLFYAETVIFYPVKYKVIE